MKSEIITKLEERISEECKPVDTEARFDDMLDECYSFESIGGPFAHMSPSRVLKEVDPVAYRCGVADYGNDDTVEVGGETYQQDEAEKVRDEFIDEIDSEISDLETEIEDAEADEEFNVSELASMKRKLADMNTDRLTVKQHAF